MADSIAEIKPAETTKVTSMKDQLIDEHVSSEVQEKCTLKRKEMDVVPSDEKVIDEDVKRIKKTSETEVNEDTTEETTTENVEEVKETGKDENDESFEIIEMPKQAENEGESTKPEEATVTDAEK